MTIHLVRTGAIAVLLSIAFVSFGGSAAHAHAEGTADNVQPIQLAMMNLPLSGFGETYASFVFDPESAGFDPEALGEGGLGSAYSTSYLNSDESATSGAVLVGSTVGLLPSGIDASTVLAAVETTLQDEIATTGGTLTEFDVASLDGSLGLTLIEPIPELGVTFQFTGVFFPLDRLLGAAVLFRFDDANIQADAIAAAGALNDRMKGVLTGKVTDFPSPLPPDVNCNGSVDAIDALLVLQLDAAVVDSLPCGALADANQDGRTNAIDAALILQYSAGIIDSLPVS